MLKLRLFERYGVRVWLCDEEGNGLRELQNRIGKLPGKVDWAGTADTCRVINDECIELDLKFVDAEEGGVQREKDR